MTILRLLLWVALLPLRLLWWATIGRFFPGRDEEEFAGWRESETRVVTSPRSRGGKYCLANVGRPIVIKYKGKRRTITPRRVISKPEFQRSYVEADADGEVKHFNVDFISIPRN